MQCQGRDIIDRVGGMPCPKNHGQLGLPDKGRTVIGFVVVYSTLSVKTCISSDLVYSHNKLRGYIG